MRSWVLGSSPNKNGKPPSDLSDLIYFYIFISILIEMASMVIFMPTDGVWTRLRYNLNCTILYNVYDIERQPFILHMHIELNPNDRTPRKAKDLILSIGAARKLVGTLLKAFLFPRLFANPSPSTILAK